MSVSSKVALYATLPALGILLYGIASIFIYPTTIEARVSILSSIATGVTVLFLISERLRESARRKLDYINRSALSPALGVGKGGIGSAHPGYTKTLSECRELLEHHGRFLRVKLYPKNILETLDLAKDEVLAYDKAYQKVLEIGYKSMGQGQFNIWATLIVLGLMDKGDYQEPLINTHREFLESLKKTEPKLVEEFSHSGKKVVRTMSEIKSKIEAFLTDNQMGEVPEVNPFERLGFPWSS